MSIVSKEEASKMGYENKMSYCDWCLHHDFGNCNNCALFKISRGEKGEEK